MTIRWSTADIPRQHGKVAMITGTGGLGYEVALALAAAGARVILAGRNAHKGAQSVRDIAAAVPGALIAFAELDLASLCSIERLAARLRESETALDILINNAGVMSPPQRRLTEDGFELQFGVNYLGHFALTLRLLPLLRGVALPRVVNVTSLAAHSGKIDFDDLQAERRYRPGVAYCQSKLAQAIFAVELQRRCENAAIEMMSTAAHPGFAKTNLFENGSGPRSAVTWISKHLAGPMIGQSAARGALPILYAATALNVSKGGLYGPTGLLSMKGPPGPGRYAHQVLNVDTAQRLWRLSEQIAGVQL